MSYFLSLLILFGTTPPQKSQSCPIVPLSVIRQQKFVNRGHHPENNRRVVFRIVNQMRKAIVVYGLKYASGFEPVGYLIEFDKSKNEWIYPTSSNRPISWQERSSLFKERHILQPGKALIFTAEMSEVQVGRVFKRTAYLSYTKDIEPCEIKSDEFILK